MDHTEETRSTMILHDGALREAQTEFSLLDPFEPGHVQPASIDLMLGNAFILEGFDSPVVADQPDDFFMIQPRQFVLGVTAETINMPAHLVGKVDGRSSWARKGLIVENAGFIDPGFSGQITLELYNISSEPLQLPVGARICQMSVQTMTGPAELPYGSPRLGSHYQGQAGPTRSAL
jgi:dCTP deaminase